jgi:hypothetical protein
MRDAYRLLQLVAQRFPVPLGTGSHSLRLSTEQDHVLILSIRMKGAFQQVYIDEEDLDRTVEEVVVDIVDLLSRATDPQDAA